MRLARMFLAAALAMAAALAAAADGPAAMRGAYINGTVHFLYWSSGDTANTLTHESGAPDPSTWKWAASATQAFTTSGVCPPDHTLNAGQAVLNNRLYYFPVGPACGQSASDLFLYCVGFDLSANPGAPTSAQVGPVNDLQTGVGSAAVTFTPLDQTDPTMYVFTNRNIWTSGDGSHWSSHDPLVPAGNDWEPIDAVVFYPFDSDPLIMVVYTAVEQGGMSVGAYAVIWNGKFDSSSVVTPPEQIAGGTHYYGAAAILGTSGDVVSMDSGDSPPFQPGQKQTCVQVFLYGTGIERHEYDYDQTGGWWTGDGSNYNSGLEGPMVFPWYEAECSADNTYQIQRQVLVINSQNGMACRPESDSALAIQSDAMVPLTTANLPINCGATWGGTVTNTSVSDDSTDPNATIWRNYWTLLGVILGSPPFAANGYSGRDLETFSNVDYGSDIDGEVSHSETRGHTLTFSSMYTVMAGLEHVFSVQDQLDLGYKYGWESGHKSTTTLSQGFKQTLGTEYEDVGDPTQCGLVGWGIFLVPEMVVQDYALFAYDYDVNTKTGSALGQDLNSIEVNDNNPAVVPKKFSLDDPGGSGDDVPGLMSGMQPFHWSQDLDFWSNPNYAWESNTSPWTVQVGDGSYGEDTVNPLTYTEGEGGSVYFSEQQQTVDTQGCTSDVSISNAATLSKGSALKGFNAEIKAGYSGHISQEVSDSTSWEKQIAADLGMMPCEDPGCTKALTIQPYFLKATDASAPWIPKAYSTQLPWCMTWLVTDHPVVSGDTGGQAPPPGLVEGTIVGGSGGASELVAEFAAAKTSGFSIRNGTLAWGKAGGPARPIPMTADEFSPSAGATVTLNNYAFTATQALGKWTRKGQAWVFQTKGSSGPKAKLTLDFGRGMWDFELSRADLAAHFRPSQADLRIGLDVNGRFKFYSAAALSVQTRWDQRLSATSPEEVEVTRYSGSFDSVKGEGSVVMEGTVPKNRKWFGDMAFSVNGHQVDGWLVSLKGYERAVAEGKELVYKGAGIRLSVDFGKGTWALKVEKEGFHPLLAPRWGTGRLKVTVGGATVYRQDHPVTDHTTKVAFGR